MKTCPNCGSKYTDATLNFCLQDGAELVSGVTESDPASASSFGERETETIISNRKVDQTNFDSGQNQEDIGAKEEPVVYSSVDSDTGNGDIFKTILLTVLGMFLIFGIGGIGAYLYFNKGGGEVGKNINSTHKHESGIKESINKPINKPKEQPTRKPTPKTTPKPIPDFDFDHVKKEVSSRIYMWKSLAESLRLEPYMENYASKIDYYKRKGASKSFVRSDKKKAFEKYTSIKAKFSRMKITSSDGRIAVAKFDKEWVFSNDTNKNTGKVRTQLKLKKTGGIWLITSEKDLKVYYVNK